MKRRFGIELEIAGIDRSSACNALNAVNIKAISEDYNHITCSHWKIISDSSVRDGFEVVSPILSGEGGVTEAEIAARALDDMGATVNVTCGFHVHFDAAGLTINQIRFLVLRYARHEGEIDSFMPKSRRENNNRHCLSVKGFLDSRPFKAATSLTELAQSMGGRYFKINLESLQRYGTIEFRHHSGTINAAKIANWVRFLDSFIDASVSMGADAASSQKVVFATGITAKVLKALEERELVTLEELMEMFGWQAHTGRSVISRMRKDGIPIETVKINGQLAYRLNQQGLTDDLWNGVHRDIMNFYKCRANVLALAA